MTSASRHSPGPQLALVAEGHPADGEAWVERVLHRDERVLVDVVLDDGRRERLRLEPARAAWLELEAGQIVGWLGAA